MYCEPRYVVWDTSRRTVFISSQKVFSTFWYIHGLFGNLFNKILIQNTLFYLCCIYWVDNKSIFFIWISCLVSDCKAWKRQIPLNTHLVVCFLKEKIPRAYVMSLTASFFDKVDLVFKMFQNYICSFRSDFVFQKCIS